MPVQFAKLKRDPKLDDDCAPPYTMYSYDPGGTTGWAQFEVVPKQGEGSAAHAYARQVGQYPLWEGLDAQIRYPMTRLVVFENIVPRSLDFNPIGIQVIGVIKFLCERWSIDALSQPNALIHGVERWGLYDLSWLKLVHGKDALMHGIVSLRNRGYDVSIADVHVHNDD